VLLGDEEGRSLHFELKKRTANVNDACLYPVEASGILYKSPPEMIHLKRVLSAGQEEYVQSLLRYQKLYNSQLQLVGGT
jgi:hypothetical protein